MTIFQIFERFIEKIKSYFLYSVTTKTSVRQLDRSRYIAGPIDDDRVSALRTDSHFLSYNTQFLNSVM